MRTAALILLLAALPAAAAAQALYAPDGPGQADAGRSWVFAGAGYSDAENLAARTARAAARAGLGEAAGCKLSLEAGFSAGRIIKDGWLPGELYDAGLRLSARGKKNFFTAGLRSASDRPFHSAHETDVSLNAARTVSRSGPHSFSAGLAYSSRRSFARNIPFPYVSYNYQSEKLTFRLPFAVSWRPAPDYEFSASYMPPKYFQAAAAWKASPELTLKAEYILTAAQYDLAGRPDKKYSVFIEQPAAGLRTSYKTSGNYTLFLYTGWSLGGRYYRGKTYDDYRDKTHIRGAPAVSLGAARLF